MLAQRVDQAVQFTRRDAGRFLAAALLLVAIIGGTLGSDILPPALNLTVGQPAPSDIRAPRARDYTSAVRTNQAPDDARENVESQYDYSQARELTIAADQLQKYEAAVSPVDAAFSPSVAPEDRAALLQTVLPGLTDEARETLVALEPDRWTDVRREASRVL